MTKELHNKFGCITCEPPFDHEDTSNHSESVLCMLRLGNLEDDTFDRDLQENLLLQAQGRYKALIHPAMIIM